VVHGKIIFQCHTTSTACTFEFVVLDIQEEYLTHRTNGKYELDNLKPISHSKMNLHEKLCHQTKPFHVLSRGS
jgi:hypothetical protein